MRVMEECGMEITSRDNRFVREMRRLLSDAKARRESGRFVLEGARLCGDALRSEVRVEAVLTTPRAAAQNAALLDALREACGECHTISAPLAGYIGDTVTPQGIFCICRMERPVPVLDNPAAFGTIRKNGRYLALENMQDPTNLGTIIRTAEAFGLDGLLLSDGCCDLYNAKVLRGSMGGVLRLPSFAAGDLARTVPALREMGFTCWACVADSAAVPLHRASLGNGCVCLIGNEGAGLRGETIAACTGRLTIEMTGRAESLNAAMAAGIVLWEMVRPVR